jgi:hypothetical protein
MSQPLSLPVPELAPPLRGEVFRIIPSRFPPIDLFEAIYTSQEEFEYAFAIEALTNPRYQQETGAAEWVAKGEAVQGPGASIVMAPFVYLSNQTRFSDGTFGVYYAARSLQTAIEETKYHRARFLRETDEADQEITMRVYSCRLKDRLHDLRPSAFSILLNPEDYRESQAYGSQMRNTGSNGLLYPSVRAARGACVAVFRPKGVTLPVQRMHLKYVYRQRSQSITDVYEARLLD